MTLLLWARCRRSLRLKLQHAAERLLSHTVNPHHATAANDRNPPPASNVANGPYQLLASRSSAAVQLSKTRLSLSQRIAGSGEFTQSGTTQALAENTLMIASVKPLLSEVSGYRLTFLKPVNF